MHRSKGFLFWICLLTASTGAYAQVSQPNHYQKEINHFSHLEDIENDYLSRHIFIETDSTTDFEFTLLSPQLSLLHNSTHAQGYNDGALWSGKGITLDASIGAQARWKRVSLTVYPRMYFSGNARFDLAQQSSTTKSIYNYQFNVIGDIDYVQRYGDASFFHADFGQSEVRYRDDYVTAAVSTENFTLGPTSIHSILMSRQAAGFPHLEIGTSRFLAMKIKNIPLGKVKFQQVYGVLEESSYFDRNPKNDDRLISTTTLEYRPPQPEGLKIGINRVFYQDLNNFESADLARNLWYFGKTDDVVDAVGDTVNDLLDQMASIYFEYLIKSSGVRIYGEFVKNDFNGSRRDFIIGTDHARAYSFGFDKLFDVLDGKLMFTYEHTNVSRTGSASYRPEPSFYQHYQTIGGYTHQGQMLGTGTGPGSHVHTIQLKYYDQLRMIELGGHRIQFDEDYFDEVLAVYLPPDFENKDRKSAEYALPIRYSRLFERWSYSLQVMPSLRYNVNYELKNDQFNLYTSLTLNYFIDN
ncbi:MAG: hypothetical protein ACI8RL_001126 [Cyclobacteriaceae bacterium]|jgi:hypothetical protein